MKILYSTVQHLIVDDAPQFKLITDTLGLCWVHEGRHYKKLNPLFRHNKEILKNFIGEFWDYYKLLDDYKKKPSNQQAQALEKKFDELFSREPAMKYSINKLLRQRIKKISYCLY